MCREGSRKFMWFTSSSRGEQTGAEHSNFEVPHQNVLHNNDGMPRLNNTELPFEPGFTFLTTEYSHAQNQLKQRHLTSFYAWRHFSITSLHVLTTKAVLSLFVFCTERWRAEVWQRRSNGQSRQPILPRHLTERLTVSLYTWQAEAVVNIH